MSRRAHKRGWVQGLATKNSPVAALQRRGGVTPFVPTDLAGLLVWLKADGTLWQDDARTTPVTADSQVVGSWDDAGPAGNHLLQTTAGAKPLYRTNVRAGQPGVHFDGTDDYLRKSFTFTQPATIFLVGGFTANKTTFDGYGTTNLCSIMALTNNVLRLYSGTAVSSPNWSVSSQSTGSGPLYCVSAVVNGASSALYRNGTLMASGNVGASNPGGITLGGPGALAAGSFLSGDIGEVIAYNTALGATDRQNVEAYLMQRWFPQKTPDTVANLAGWYRADDLSTLRQNSDLTGTVASDADPVGAWMDASGNGRHLLQATAGSRPTVKLAIKNGLPVIRFDGTDDWLKAAPFTLNQPVTAFMVFNWTTGNNLLDGNALNGGAWVAVSATQFGLRAPTAFNSGANINGAGFRLMSWLLNGASSVIYNEGAQNATGSAGTNNMGGLTVGSTATQTLYCSEDVAELVLYSGTLVQADREGVSNYLRAKFSIP